MTLIKSLSIFLFVAFVSCNSTNKSVVKNTNKSETESIKMKMEKMIEEGFSMGEIVFSDAENDCAYTIKLDNKEISYYLDPINLDEAFQKDGMKVWVKYNGLRMMNRCDKANPVSLTDIQEREE
jgi:hypothetical protein